MKLCRHVVLMACLFVLVFSGEKVLAAEGDSNSLASEMPEYVELIADEDLDEQLVYGARIFLNEDTKYYASADLGGSGKFGTIGNRYTPLGTDLYVGGFALSDEDGHLETFEGYIPNKVPISGRWQNDVEVSWDQIWVAIFLNPDDNSLIGWVPARSVVVLNGILGDEKSNAKFRNGVIVNDVPPADDELGVEIIDTVLPDPGNAIEDRVIQGQDANEGEDCNDRDDDFISTREIAYAIEDYADNGDKVALLLDGSGSVSEYMSDIANYGEYVDRVNKADVIMTFGADYKVITAEEYLTSGVDIGGTDIYTPLKNLPDISSYDRIIIVTDTWHNEDLVTLHEEYEFSGKIVIVCPTNLAWIRPETITDIEASFDTRVYLCRLDNELDRIRAFQAIGR